MSQQSDQFDRILRTLQEAMLGATGWRETSALIDDFCGATGSHLVITGDNRDNPEWLFDLFYYHGEHAGELARDYIENYFPSDERIPRLMRLPDREIVRMADLYTASERNTSSTYNDLLRRTGARDGLNVRMDGPDGLNIVWVMADSGEPDGWSSGQIGRIARLLPEVRQFVRVRQALAAAEARTASLTELLDNTMIGVLYLDWRGKIVEANARARAVLIEGGSLVEREGVLVARAATERAILERTIARALSPSADATGGSLAVSGRSPGSRHVLHVTPVSSSAAHFGAFLPAAQVLILDWGMKKRVDPALLMATVGLTPAESEVAAALTSGSSVAAVAAATNRKVSTVRWFVRQLYAKLGVANQAELAAAVLSVSPALLRLPPQDHPAPKGPPTR